MTMDGTMRIEGFGMQDVTMAMSQTVSWKTVKVNADGRLRALKVETSGNRTQLVFPRTEIERFKEREPRSWR